MYINVFVLLLAAIVLVIITPSNSLYYNLITRTSKRLGYPAFFILLGSYLLFWFLIIYLLTIEYINFTAFIVLWIMTETVGGYVLRKKLTGTKGG